MMLVMILYIPDTKRSCHVEARVVEACHEASCNDEEDHRVDVARHAEDTEKMQVFTRNKFERMHVDGVLVASAWCHLRMVMLVNKPVHRVVMQKAVKEAIY